MLNLCADHAPNGDIILSSGAQWNKIKYCQNAGVTLDENATAEDLESAWDKLMDMSEIKVRSAMFA